MHTFINNDVSNTLFEFFGPHGAPFHGFSDSHATGGRDVVVGDEVYLREPLTGYCWAWDVVQKPSPLNICCDSGIISRDCPLFRFVPTFAILLAPPALWREPFGAGLEVVLSTGSGVVRGAGVVSGGVSLTTSTSPASGFLELGNGAEVVRANGVGALTERRNLSFAVGSDGVP